MRVLVLTPDMLLVRGAIRPIAHSTECRVSSASNLIRKAMSAGNDAGRALDGTCYRDVSVHF